MQLFDPNNPNEKKKMIAAAVLGVGAIAILGYVFFGGSGSTKPATSNTIAKASPTPRIIDKTQPVIEEDPSVFQPIVYTNTLPAVSLTTQRRLLRVEDSILMTFPEVASVWGKAGRANTATDWAPMSMVETIVNLKPESEWRPGMTQDRLIAAMDQRLRLTGAVNKIGRASCRERV